MVYNKILIVRLDRLGDFILTLPAIKAIKNNFPQAKISLLVRPFLKEFAASLPYISQVFVYNPNEVFLKKLKLFKNLRRQKFDLAIDFMYAPDIKPALFTLLSGAKQRIGFGIGLKSFFLTKIVPRTKHLKYEGERHLDIIYAMGLKISPKSFKIELNQKVVSQVKKKFGIKKNNKRYICLHPGVYRNEKRRLWSSEKFAELADNLIEKYNAQIILTGGKNEVYLVNEIVRKSNYHLINLAGKTSILELCALISLVDLTVCTLTSVAHISYFLGKPTITLCGPTPYERWTDKDYIVIKKDVPCSPCEHLPKCIKQTNVCMEEIDVKDVIGAVHKIFGKQNIFKK